MNKDKNALYILSSFFAGVLLLLCVALNFLQNKYLIAAFSAVFFLLFSTFIKKRSILNIEHKQVNLILLAAALSVIALYYATGIGFGFYKIKPPVSLLWQYNLPCIITIIFSENIRKIMLAQHSKFANILSYITLVLIDVLLLSEGEIFKSFYFANDFFAMALFPSITSNVLYHFISKSYGATPNIIYKVLIFNFSNILRLRPIMPESLHSFAKILIPILLMFFIMALYVKKPKFATKKSKALKLSLSAIGIIFMTAFIMLVSCQFRFGILVIATESMTGAIDKGDAIIYEQYDDQIIKEGQILVFNINKSNTVHRVVKIENVDGQTRIYTKGDANEGMDSGYITTDDVIGVLKLKIKYLGYPTILARELFR